MPHTRRVQVEVDTQVTHLINERGVQIAAGSVRILEQTFIAKNITSVRAEYEDQGFVYGVSGMFGVVALAFFVYGHWVLGIGAAVIALIIGKTKSRLFIVTSSGEAKALEADAAFVQKVHDAVVAVSSAAR